LTSTSSRSRRSTGSCSQSRSRPSTSSTTSTSSGRPRASSASGSHVHTEMEVPDVQYAKSGDVNIAYQVTGDGPFDLVFIPGYVTHLEIQWRMAGMAPAFERLSSIARLIRFDKRGTGMSDRVSGAPTLETRMDDARAVMDA